MPHGGVRQQIRGLGFALMDESEARDDEVTLPAEAPKHPREIRQRFAAAPEPMLVPPPLRVEAAREDFAQRRGGVEGLVDTAATSDQYRQLISP